MSNAKAEKSNVKADYSALLADKSKCELGALDIFDKVINLKLTVSEKDKNGNWVEKEPYIIRSDYEMYFPKLMNSVASGSFDGLVNEPACYIRKCTYKPSIKVQYKRVSMSTPVAIDIFINNFYMLDKSGKMIKSFNNETFQLTKVELAMGYFGQFAASMGGKEASAVTIDQLFDFDADKLKGNGITLITMSDVSYVQTDKLPPDMTVHIHGFVGALYSDRLQDLSVEKGLPTDFEDIISKETVINYNNMNKNKRKTILEETFYQAVTRNWVREGSLPSDTTIKLMNSENFTVAGVLSDDDAEKYGVQVYFSDGAKKFAEKYDEDKIQVDAEGNKVIPEALKIPSASTAMEKANAVKNTYALENFRITPIPSNGNLLVYLAEELTTPSKMLEGTAMAQMYKKDTVELYWKNKLPAVYNITVDALCTIVCPFFFFLNPFQKFYFKSRYALGGLVSYYANFNAAEDEFYALWQTVSFATVENVNECTIVCTGKKQEEK